MELKVTITKVELVNRETKEFSNRTFLEKMKKREIEKLIKENEVVLNIEYETKKIPVTVENFNEAFVNDVLDNL